MIWTNTEDAGGRSERRFVDIMEEDVRMLAWMPGIL